MTSTWTKPNFIELCMNAEIGGYQQDDDREPRENPVLASTSARQSGVAEMPQNPGRDGQHASHVA
jgi:hypothetical protein